MNRAAFVIEHPQPTALRPLNYTPEIERMRRSSGSRKGIPLGTLLESIGAGYGKVFTRIDCLPPHGVELVSQADMFAAEPEGRRIREDCIPVANDHRIERGQVLIAGAGTLGETELYGRAILADNRLRGKYVGPHAMVLNFVDPLGDQALFAYAFLLTRLGVRAVRSASYGTKILGLRTSILRNLPIPSGDSEVHAAVSTLIRQSLRSRETFAHELAAARAPLERMPVFQDALAACETRRARVDTISAPFHTLNAWNYVSTGEALPLLRRGWGGRLGDVLPADGVFRGLRFPRIACSPPFGIDLMSQRDVFLTRAIPQRVVHPGFDDRWLFAKEGTILVGGAGTLGEGEIFGRAVYVSKDMGRFAVTEDMLRLEIKPENAQVVYAFLSTTLGRRLLRSTAFGTKLLRLRPDLVRALPIPDVDSTVSADITGHLNTAMQARDEANRAEAEAVRLVETEVIPAWLS